MKLLEVVRALETDDDTLASVVEVGRRMGKEVVVIRESPGLVTSRINAMIGNEAFYMLQEGIGSQNELTLVRSDRALTDCRPVSLISMQTITQLEAEMKLPLDKRRFRANMYVNLSTGSGFGEDGFVGRKLRIGRQAVVAVLERDPRCKVMSLDPDTGGHNPEILRKVVSAHDNYAGVYCAVLVEGSIADSDSITLLD